MSTAESGVLSWEWSWSPVGAIDSLADPGLGPGEERTVMLLELEACGAAPHSAAPLDLLVVLDASFSMALEIADTTRLALAQGLLTALLQRLRPEDRLHVVPLQGGRVRPSSGALRAADADRLRAFLDGLQPWGTAPGAATALEGARATVRVETRRDLRTVWLSDRGADAVRKTEGPDLTVVIAPTTRHPSSNCLTLGGGEEERVADLVLAPARAVDLELTVNFGSSVRSARALWPGGIMEPIGLSGSSRAWNLGDVLENGPRVACCFLLGRKSGAPSDLLLKGTMLSYRLPGGPQPLCLKVPRKITTSNRINARAERAYWRLRKEWLEREVRSRERPCRGELGIVASALVQVADRFDLPLLDRPWTEMQVRSAVLPPLPPGPPLGGRLDPADSPFLTPPRAREQASIFSESRTHPTRLRARGPVGEHLYSLDCEELLIGFPGSLELDVDLSVVGRGRPGVALVLARANQEWFLRPLRPLYLDGDLVEPDQAPRVEAGQQLVLPDPGGAVGLELIGD